MASSSSSFHHHAFSGIEPDTKRRKVSESSKVYEVFINHRGPDAKKTLADPLYTSLQKLGLRPYLDCKETELGDYFPSALETAIRSASAHIAIFSEGYAQSPWCLAELVLMLQSEAKIFPLFCGVKPSELRYIENGVYAAAFRIYKEKGRYLQKLESWKEALHSASFFNGLEINSAESFRNSEDFENLVLKVQEEVERTKLLFVAKYPVGLEKLVKDFESRCLHELVRDFENQCGLNIEGKDHSKIVGIFGMGGAGKTTLATELFNRKRSEYNRTCFLFDVRESSRYELPALQGKLLSDLFNEDPPKFQSMKEGSNYIRDRLGRSRFLSFLIVVDDIDHVKQLDTLCIMDLVKESRNSLVIVTTRDVGVLTSAGITNRYNLKGLNRDDGRELFCWHSFGHPYPASGYENLVDAFIVVCGGLPLSLQVLGRHVYGRPADYWKGQLCKVHASLDPDIKDILKISFDALHSVEKQIFMDIACFFVDKSKNTAIRVWEGSGWEGSEWEGSGWRVRYALETLKDRCLVEESERLDRPLWENDLVVLKMHDHLRDLGREMSNELDSPPRHWSPKYCKYLESKGFENILAQTKGRCFHSIFDRSTGSKISYFMGKSEEYAETSTSLLWLQLDLNCRELSSIPPWIPLQNLQCLRISHGSLKRLWQSNVQAPAQLKELQIYQTTLEEFPDFLGISNNLEQVVLDARDMPIESWSLLESLRVYPRSLVLTCSTLHGELACNNRGDKTNLKSSHLTSLVIRNFVKLSEELPLYNIGESTAFKCPLSNLENLEICNQIYVTKILICGNYCPSLLSLKIHDMDYLIEMDLLGVKTLDCLEINTCKSLKRLSETSNFRNLLVFNISECPELEELSLAPLTCLEKIIIKNCEQLKSVSGLSNLRKPVKLDISHCSVLELCFVDVSSLEEIRVGECWELKCLKLNGCKRLKMVEMFNLEKLVTLNICDCPELQELVVPEGSNCLEWIIIGSCQNLKSVSGISHVRNLVELNISQCWELDLELHLKCMNSLERFIIDECPKLNYLLLDRCQFLKSVSGHFDPAMLHIMECPELEELPCFARLTCLEYIIIINCGKLQNIALPTTLINLAVGSCRELRRVAGIDDLTKLTELSICECPELEELPSLSRLTCLKQIEIAYCQKLQNIVPPITLTNLSLKGCRELQRVAGIDELPKLTNLFICDSTQLEEFPGLSGMSCLEKLEIESCEKLQNIALPATLVHLSVEGCIELERVVGISDHTKLTEMNIKDCPELEELPNLSGMKCLQSIQIDTCEKLENIDIEYCEKLQNITPPTTLINLSVKGCRELRSVAGFDDLTKLKVLKISECPEFEELPSFARLSCLEEILIDSCEKLENIEIKYCEKLQNITLLTTLEYLSVKGCRELQRVAVIGDLTELTEMNISDCPELEELPNPSGMSCLVNLEIESCEKLQNITLPTTLEYLSVKGCRELQRVAVIGDLTKLRRMIISDCPELEELPNLSGMSCLEKLEIESREKLQNIALPATLFYLSVKGCRELQRVVEISDLTKLTEMIISDCPELEELPNLSGMSCLENLEIKYCEKLQNITLPTTLINLDLVGCRELQRVAVIGDLTKLERLSIYGCPELEELPSLASLSCLKKIVIHSCEKLENIYIEYCEKLQNVTLPTTLINLSVKGCRELRSVAEFGNLTKLRVLEISECPKLEELPSLARLSCLEEIVIDSCEKLKKIKIEYCEKLQNITLPTTLIDLYLAGCRELQRVAVIGDLIKLKSLSIYGCPELEELPSLSRLSWLREIVIDSCEKLKNISGIEEFGVSGYMRLCYCGNAVIRNCIHKLKSVPWRGMTMIGRAVDGAESILNEYLFAEAHIGADALTDAVTDEWIKWPDLSAFSDEWPDLSGVIGCYVVVVDSSTSVQDINKSLHWNHDNNLEVRQGEWIITIASTRYFQDNYMRKVEDVLRMYGIMKKGFRVLVKVDEVEKWKSVHVLHTIVDRLHYL